MLSEPVVGEQFFGRREILNLLQKRVNALKEGYRQNLALTGQNLSGKTSIIHHFLYNFSDNNILPIYVELTDESFWHFSRRFIGSLLYNFLKTKGLDPKEDLEALIEDAHVYIPRTVKSITDIQSLIKKKANDEAFSELFNLTTTIKEEAQKSCVIIFDEFHNLATLDVKQPFKILGKKIMIQKETMYIVTSSQVNTVKRILNERLSLLFGNFETVEVDGFTQRGALGFLDERFKYIRFPNEYKNFIIALTQGNPFYLDMISVAIKEIVTPMTFKRITQDLLIQALEKAVFNSKGGISLYLTNLLEIIKKSRSPQICEEILLAVANGHYHIKLISRIVKKRTSDITKYAKELLEANILVKNGSFYIFVDSLFAFWLKFVYQRRRSAIISYLPDRINIFHEELKGLIDRFLSQEKKEITERVAELFNLFNNESVYISDRECRLPSFTSIDIKYFENGEPYLLSKTKNNYWLTYISVEELKDIDIIELTERYKALNLKLQRRVLVTLSGIEANARLMAKEENIWIWDLSTLNQLMALYGKETIVNIVYRGRETKII